VSPDTDASAFINSGSKWRVPTGFIHPECCGFQVSRLLDLVKSQLHNRKQYIRQVEGALQVCRDGGQLTKGITPNCRTEACMAAVFELPFTNR
jgi:hypothetical protein